MRFLVRNAYQGIETEYETLLGAFGKDNESFKKQNDVSMLDLTLNFIKEYEVYLSTEAGFHNGSIWVNCMWLKSIVLKAHYNGLIPRSPFALHKVSPNIKDRVI